MGWQVADANGIDLTFAAMLRFGSGAIALFDSGFQSPYRSEMEIIGADAALRVALPFKAGPDSRLRLLRDNEETPVAFAADPPYLGEVRTFTRPSSTESPIRCRWTNREGRRACSPRSMLPPRPIAQC